MSVTGFFVYTVNEIYGEEMEDERIPNLPNIGPILPLNQSNLSGILPIPEPSSETLPRTLSEPSSETLPGTLPKPEYNPNAENMVGGQQSVSSYAHMLIGYEYIIKAIVLKSKGDINKNWWIDLPVDNRVVYRYNNRGRPVKLDEIQVSDEILQHMKRIYNHPDTQGFISNEKLNQKLQEIRNDMSADITKVITKRETEAKLLEDRREQEKQFKENLELMKMDNQQKMREYKETKQNARDERLRQKLAERAEFDNELQNQRYPSDANSDIAVRNRSSSDSSSIASDE